MSQSTSYPGAIPPPPGVVPDVNTPWSHLQYTYITAFVIAAVIPTIFAVLRLYVKAIIVKKWAWADAIFFLSWALFICDLAFCASNVNHGVYQHAWNITHEQFSKIQGTINIIQVIYVVTNTLCKVSIMIQLADIFVPHKPHHRWNILLGLIAFTVGFYAVIFFIELFWCSPPSKIWNPDLPGKCIDNSTIYIATSIVNVFDDFAIFALPVIWTFKLHISSNQKIKVVAVFAVGLFACICSIIRLIYSVRLLRTPDLSWTIAPVAMWAMAEIAAGLVVATMPYMPRLVKKSKKDQVTNPSVKLTSQGSASSEEREKDTFELVDQPKGRSSLSSFDRSIHTQDEEWLGDLAECRKDFGKKDSVSIITKSVSVQQYSVPIGWNEQGNNSTPNDFPYYQK